MCYGHCALLQHATAAVSFGHVVATNFVMAGYWLDFLLSEYPQETDS